MNQDFKIVQSVKNDIKKNEKETLEKIKDESIKQANKELVNANNETNTQQNNENFTNYETFINKVSVETEYDFEKYNSYTDAVNKCLSKKGRLCYPGEVSSGNGSAYGLFNLNDKNEFGEENHPKYTESQCKILGLNFDETKKRCYINENNKNNELDMLSTVNIKDGKKVPLWLPISLDNNGNAQYMNIGEGVTDTDIGFTTTEESKIKSNQKLLLKCCDVGETSLCEGNRTLLTLMDKDIQKLNKNLQELNQSSDSNKEIQIKMITEKIKELNAERNNLQKKLWMECDKHNYFDALTSLKNFRKIYKELFNEHKRAVYNRTLIENKMMKYIYFEGSDGKRYVENDSTRSRKRKGLIPDLETEIKKYKKIIKEELERIENCPVPNSYNNSILDGKGPSCEDLANKENPTEIPFAQQPKEEVENKKCSPNDIKNYLINSGKLSQETVIKLLQMSNVNNLLKDTDIRNHKDFYKYIKSSKINSCPKADKDAKITINQKTIKDFNIKDHQDYNKYIRLDNLPENRVPAANMKLWKKLKGLN